MRQRIGLDELYTKALHLARAATDTTGTPRPFSETCPFRLDELLADGPDVAALAARMSGP